MSAVLFIALFLFSGAIAVALLVAYGCKHDRDSELLRKVDALVKEVWVLRSDVDHARGKAAVLAGRAAKLKAQRDLARRLVRDAHELFADSIDMDEDDAQDMEARIVEWDAEEKEERDAERRGY